MYLLLLSIADKDEYMSSKLFPSQINPVFSFSIASAAPPSLPPIDGIPYWAAAQYGIPSIGGKDGGAADAIENEKTGLICDGNNLDDIYSSLSAMLNSNKYIEYGKNAKEYVSKFQWEKILEEYKKILN